MQIDEKALEEASQRVHMTAITALPDAAWGILNKLDESDRGVIWRRLAMAALAYEAAKPAPVSAVPAAQGAAAERAFWETQRDIPHEEADAGAAGRQHRADAG